MMQVSHILRIHLQGGMKNNFLTHNYRKMKIALSIAIVLMKIGMFCAIALYMYAAQPVINVMVGESEGWLRITGQTIAWIGVTFFYWLILSYAQDKIIEWKLMRSKLKEVEGFAKHLKAVEEIKSEMP